MRRRRKQAPNSKITRLPTAKGEWQVTVRWTPEGKPRQRERHEFPTEAKARAYERDAMVRVHNNAPPSGREAKDERSFSTGDACRLYERRHANRPETCPRARERMIQHRKNIEATSLWKIPVEDVTLTHLDEVFPGERRANAKRKKAGISNETIAKDLRHLRAVFRFCKRDTKVTKVTHHLFESMEKSDRTRLMPSWKPTFTKGRIVPPEEQAAIMASLNPKAKRMARFLTVGVRKGQAASLDWKTHFRDFPYPHFAPTPQKGDKQRIIPFEAVEPIVGPRQTEGLVFAELGSTEDEIYERFTRCWRYAARKAKSTARPHDLRHSFGSILRRTHSLEDVASIMGISARTAETYADHEKADRTREAYRRFAAAEPLKRSKASR